MNLIDLSCGLRDFSAYSGFLFSQKSTHVRSTTSSPVLLTRKEQVVKKSNEDTWYLHENQQPHGLL